MKTQPTGGQFRTSLVLATLVGVIILVSVVLLWQPIVALAQSAIRTLENQLFLPLVIQSEDQPSPTPTEPTPTEPSPTEPSPTPTEPVPTPGPPPELGAWRPARAACR